MVGGSHNAPPRPLPSPPVRPHCVRAITPKTRREWLPTPAPAGSNGRMATPGPTQEKSRPRRAVAECDDLTPEPGPS